MINTYVATAHQNQAWRLNTTDGTIRETMSGSCLDRSNGGTLPGTLVWLYHVTGQSSQAWFNMHSDLHAQSDVV